jgi:hypothetical protein
LPFLLGLGLTITVVKAVAVDLSPGAATRDGFKAIGLACLKQMIGNNPALLAGDPEGVHQMRVGLQRLRAAISLFADILLWRWSMSRRFVSGDRFVRFIYPRCYPICRRRPWPHR